MECEGFAWEGSEVGCGGWELRGWSAGVIVKVMCGVLACE